MKFNTFVITVYVALSYSHLFCQSKIDERTFFSASLDTIRHVNVYLPDAYEQENIEKKYPVIYFLHGGGGNHDSYKAIYSILDSLISNNIMEPVILVKPDGSCKPYLGSQYMNSELYGKFEDYIVFDLVDYIDRNYHTYSSRTKRFIMGHSMGGEGSMRIALKYPDRYAGVASHSGVLSIEFIHFLTDAVLKENEPYSSIKPSSGYMSQALFTASGGYSPNKNNPPFYVDLPIDKNGEIVESVWERWKLNDPLNLASTYDPSHDLKIFFDCGTQDPILKVTSLFAGKLSDLGIPFIFHAYEGTHSNKLSERFCISLTFFNSLIH